MPKKHSDKSPITQLAKEIHLRLEREYGHPVEFVIAAVNSNHPLWVDIATNSQDGALFHRMLSAIKEAPAMDSKTFVIPDGGSA